MVIGGPLIRLLSLTVIFFRCKDWSSLQLMLGGWMDCWGSVASNRQWDLLWTQLVCRLAKHDWKGVEEEWCMDDKCDMLHVANALVSWLARPDFIHPSFTISSFSTCHCRSPRLDALPPPSLHAHHRAARGAGRDVLGGIPRRGQPDAPQDREDLHASGG